MLPNKHLLLGCTPNLLCFGEELVLPVDLMFGTATDKRPWIRPDGSTCFTEYVETKRQRLVDSFSAARQVLKKSATHANPHRRQDIICSFPAPIVSQASSIVYVGSSFVITVLKESSVPSVIEEDSASFPFTSSLSHVFFSMFRL